MFWWFANSPGTTNHHIPDVLPGVWGELATDGNRWNEDINRAAYRSLENPPPVGKSPIPSTPFSNDIVLPAVPIATHIPFRIREEKLRRKYTRYGDAFPNEENKALWARLGVVTCDRKGDLVWNHGKGYERSKCERPCFDDSLYCDLHTCTLFSADGNRCTNIVLDPSVTRYCSEGFHTENGLGHHLDDLIENAKVENERERISREIAEEKFMHAMRIAPIDRSFYVTDNPLSPSNKPKSLHGSESSGSASASTTQLLTPPLVNSELIMDSVSAWNRGTEQANAIAGPSGTQHSDVTPPCDQIITPTEVIEEATGLGLITTVPTIVFPDTETPSPSGQSLDTGMVIYGFDVQPNPLKMKAELKKLRIGQGSKMAQMMTERYGNGYIRRQAFHRDSADTI